MGLRCYGTNRWVNRIIEDARARDPTLPTLAEVVGISSDPFGIDEKSDSDGVSVPPSIDQLVDELHDEYDTVEPKPALRPEPKSRRASCASS